MTDAEFYSLYQNTLVSIEDAVDDADADLDFESVDDILTVTCPDGSQVIVTRQSANQQLWVAARSGGFHFEWNETDSRWQLTRDGSSLQDKLNEIFLEQAGVALNL